MTHNQKVGIIMGSDSDLSIMQGAAKYWMSFKFLWTLDCFRTSYTAADVWICPNCRKSGLSLIIAGAGGAAHLPGMVAALTVVPVIGVPVQSKAMNGSTLSIR